MITPIFNFIKHYNTNQDNDGVSTTYVDGIPVSTKKYDKKGNITYLKMALGQVTLKK